MSSFTDDEFTSKFGGLTFPEDGDELDIDLKTARTFVILKRLTPSKHGYGKCAVCGAHNTTFRFWLERRYFGHTYVRFDVYLNQKCHNCWQENSWPCLGLAEADFKPNSCFYSKRDSQRQKCYTWEDKHLRHVWGKRDLHCAEEATKLFLRIFEKYHMEKPKLEIKISKNGKMFGEYKMVLPSQWGCTPWIVVHEAAHAVAHKMMRLKYFPHQAGHGSLWVAVYLLMIEEWLSGSYGGEWTCAERLRETAEKDGIQVLDLEPVRQALELFRSGNAPK